MNTPGIPNGRAVETLLNEMEHGSQLRRDHSALVAHLPRIGQALDNVRAMFSKQDWECFCKTCLRQHEFREIFLQDPFTRHSFERPCGYPGDAELLDYIYGYKLPPAQTSALGKAIFRYTVNVPSSQGVRERCDLLAKVIDEVSAQTPPRILSLGAGHLRESDSSDAVRQDAVAELIALDHDPRSLAVIRCKYPDAVAKGNLKLIEGNIRNVLEGSIRFTEMDFVYAAGLFDYLSQRMAARICRDMFNMLRPGGRCLVANFAPTLPDIGYMEAFMRWHLIYRNEQAMADLTKLIPASLIAKMQLKWNKNNTLLFLELTRS